MQPTDTIGKSAAKPEAVPSAATPGARERLMLTAAEYQAMETELIGLKDHRDRVLPARLRDARTYVNADAIEEMTQLREDQTVADVRIARITEMLDNATVLSGTEAADRVMVGCLVEVEYSSSGLQVTYQLTGAGSGAGSGVQSVSARSPIGQVLMGQRVGETVCAELPGGRTEALQILGIKPVLADAV